MRHEIITIQDLQLIGISKQIASDHGYQECPKFWDEFRYAYYQPMYTDSQQPGPTQQAIIANQVGEFALCAMHDEATFTYAICGRYRGGEVPEGMQLYPVRNGQWLKLFFDGGVASFQDNHRFVYNQWLPSHPEIKLAPEGGMIEWYGQGDPYHPYYQCGILLPLE